jgi:hypothetical protein
MASERIASDCVVRRTLAVCAALRIRQAAASEANEPGSVKRQRRTNHTSEATVPDERAEESVNDGACGRDATCEEVMQRRNSNRERMRRRRADPTRRAREKARRKSVRSAASVQVVSTASGVAQPMGRVCAICHLRSAVEEIVRLEPSELTRSGYVQVRLPYCGRC